MSSACQMMQSASLLLKEFCMPEAPQCPSECSSALQRAVGHHMLTNLLEHCLLTASGSSNPMSALNAGNSMPSLCW